MDIVIIGASGLVGQDCLKMLANDMDIRVVKALVRKPLTSNFLRVEQHIIDFDNEDTYRSLLQCDVFVCCLGTTMRQAGSKEQFRKVDRDYPAHLAKLAFEQGAKACYVVSAIGADPGSTNFYLRTKGEMEKLIKAIPFSSVGIFRPSMLLGNREEFRLGERVAGAIMQLLSFVFIGALKKYKAVTSEKVAKSIHTAIKEAKPGVTVYDSDQINNIPGA